MPEADGDDHEAGGEAEPGEEGFGEDVFGGEEDDDAEGEDAGDVCDRDDGAEEHRVAGGAVGPDEVGGDDGLAVAGGEGVKRAEDEGDGEGQEHDGEGEALGGDEAREAVLGGGGVAVGRGLR